MAAPVININTTGAKGLTNVDNAETTTNWAGFRHSGGGSPTPVQDSVRVQGSFAVSSKVSGSTRDEGLWYTNVGSADLTTDANKHVYIWAAMVDMAQLDAIAAGGFYLIVASAVGNWNKYYVAGSDTIDGRFVRYVVDVTKQPSETAATAATLTAVTHLGMGIKSVSITGKAENLIVDRIDYGTGFQIEAGDTTTPGSWEEAFLIDDAAANKYGILQKEANGTYSLTGGVTWGDPAGTVTSLWDDESGAVVKFKNPTYHNGTAIVSSIDATTLYELEHLGNGTGTTDFKLGAVVGSGDDRQGLSGGLIGTDGPKWSWDSKADITDLDTVNLYGVTFEGAGITEFDILSKTEIIGCTFTNCGEVKPTLADWLNNTVGAPIPDRGLEVVASTNVQQTTLVSGISGSDDTRPVIRAWQVDISATPDLFTEFTDELNSAATGDVTPFPATEAAGDYFAIGSDRIFAATLIDTGTARSGGSLLPEYFNGSTWSELVLLQDGTNSLSTTGLRTTRWEIPANWAKTSLNGEEPLFYMRWRVITVMSTNPILDRGFITEIEEHLLHYPVAGTENADGLVCFGAAVHVENSAASTTEDSYAFSNQDVTAALGASNFLGRAQSLTGAGGVLSAVLVRMSKAASTDVADMTCRIYAHGGVFGTSSIPTGPALATSNAVSTSTLSELSERTVYFEFEDEFTLVNLTNYCVAFEVAAVFSSGQVDVGLDTSSPTHAGNASSLVGTTWTSGTADIPFFVQSGAILKLSLVNGSTIATDDNSNALPGATILVNNLSITFDELIVNTEVRVYLAGTSTEVDGIESNPDADFSFSIGSGVSVDYVILGPIVGSLAYVPIRRESISFTADTTVVINQQINRNFSNP